MIKNRRTLIIAFIFCAFVLAIPAGAQESAERPIKISGHVTSTFDLTTGAGVALDWGEATHTGRYLNTMTLQLNPVTGVTGSGTATAANGDQLFWEMHQDTVTYSGGTGGFENITGGFQYTASDPVTTTTRW